MWERITSELAQGLSAAPIKERAHRAATALEDAPETSMESTRNRAIERLRHARLAPASEAGLDDLEMLGVELPRAHAAKQEAYESALQLVMSAIVPQSELATSFLNGFLARVTLTASIHRYVDRRSVRGVLHSPERSPPPVWYPELHQALKIPEGSLHSDSERVLGGVAQRVTAAGEEKPATARKSSNRARRRRFGRSASLRSGRECHRQNGRDSAGAKWSLENTCARSA